MKNHASIVLVPALILLAGIIGPVSAQTDAALAAPSASKRKLELSTLSADKISVLKQETISERFKHLIPRLQLKEALTKFMNLKEGRSIQTDMSAPSVYVYQQLEKSGLANDGVYVSHVLDVIRSGRILGPSTLDTFHPDCVAIGAAPFYFCCSGTLIAPQLVLTAGHCADGCANFVVVGTSVDAAGRSQLLSVKEKRRHPGFKADDKTIVHDLTLLVLAEPVKDVTPRRIATAAEIAAAKEAWIVGFGTTNNQGTSGYGQRRVGGPALFADPANAAYGADPATEVVLGKHPADLDSCRGDSGGPIYILTPEGEFLAGATSRSVRNATQVCGDGGVYVRPDVYLPWILAIAQEAGVAPPEVRGK